MHLLLEKSVIELRFPLRLTPPIIIPCEVCYWQRLEARPNKQRYAHYHNGNDYYLPNC